MLENLTQEDMEGFDPNRSYAEQSAEVAGVEKADIFRVTKDTVLSFWTVQKYINQAVAALDSGDLPQPDVAKAGLSLEDFQATQRVLDTISEEFKTDLFKMVRDNPEFLLEMIQSISGNGDDSEQESSQSEPDDVPHAGYL